MSSTPDYASDNESAAMDISSVASSSASSAAMDISSIESGSDNDEAESPGESTPLRYCCRRTLVRARVRVRSVLRVRMRSAGIARRIAGW